jgi:HEPN domain-containing protein
LLRTHDLVALLSACVAVEPKLSALQSDCQELSHYAVASRYPADLYEPSEKDARAMIDAARRVQTEILARLRSPNE